MDETAPRTTQSYLDALMGPSLPKGYLDAFRGPSLPRTTQSYLDALMGPSFDKTIAKLTTPSFDKRQSYLDNFGGPRPSSRTGAQKRPAGPAYRTPPIAANYALDIRCYPPSEEGGEFWMVTVLDEASGEFRFGQGKSVYTAILVAVKTLDF